MLSGKDEKPFSGPIEACEVMQKCRNAEPEMMYYEILNIEDEIIGYINTRQAIANGNYNDPIDIHIKYIFCVEEFEKTIMKIHCPNCSTFYGEGYADIERYNMFKGYIRTIIRKELHHFEENM